MSRSFNSRHKKNLLPGQLGVLWDCVSCQALSQQQALLPTWSDVVEALRQEDHAGPSLLGLLHQLFTGREVGLFVRGGRHLTHCSHRQRWRRHPAQRRGCCCCMPGKDTNSVMAVSCNLTAYFQMNNTNNARKVWVVLCNIRGWR